MRDLRPTMDMRTVLKGAFRDHLRWREQARDASVIAGQRFAQTGGGTLGVKNCRCVLPIRYG